MTSPADDANARDKSPGDGLCEDTFTNANPDAAPRCTLRAAVDEANATAGEVVINLPGQLAGGMSGAYTLSRVAPNTMDATYENDNAYGDLDLGGPDAQFSSLTIRGTGTPGPSVSIGPNDRIFHLLGGTVRMERLTVTGGTARAGANGVSSPGMGQGVDGRPGADGGCILIETGTTATFDQLSVNNCATQSGGNGASPAQSGTTGGNAGRGGNGGGIANFGTLTVRRSFVAENGTGDAGSAGAGTAGMGGAVAGGAGGNAGSGGGIYSEGTLTVEASTVFNNTAGDPSQGAAGTNGGAMGMEGEGGSGGGIAILNGATASLRNTIVAGNSAGDDPQTGKQPGSDLWDGDPADDDGSTATFTTGTFQDNNFNLIGTNNSVETAFPVGSGANIVGTGEGSASTRIDPMISGQNQNQNEAIANYPLLTGSPAIDAGEFDSAASGATDPLSTDGRGFRRPAQGQGQTDADIGAYEANSQPAKDRISISELDAVTGSPDDREFVELRNAGTTPVQLADYALVFFDGADNLAYRSVNLQGALAPGATFVLGNAGVANVTQTFGSAQSDVPDAQGAVALYRGKASDYPTGARAGQNTDTRADVIVYDNRRQRGIMDAGDLAGAFGVPEENIAMGDDAANSVQQNPDGTYAPGSPTPGMSMAVASDGAASSEAFALSAAAPNPARTSARLTLNTGADEAVRVEVYDALGRRVATLHDGPTAGPLALALDAARLAPGVYVVRATTATSVATQRVTVVR